MIVSVALDTNRVSPHLDTNRVSSHNSHMAHTRQGEEEKALSADKPAIVGRVTLSAPGAAVEVVRLDLSPEAKVALSAGSARIRIDVKGQIEALKAGA